MKFLEEDKDFSFYMRRFMEKAHQEVDARILASLIGSRIIDFRLECIPKRKSMYWLTIETDAKPVIGLTKNVRITPSKIRVKVKF